MRSLLLLFVLSLVGLRSTQALGQGDNNNTPQKNKATVQWPTQIFGKRKKAKSISGLDLKSALLVRNSLDFHQALVKRDLKTIRFRTSNYLKYGHSNGWIETQEEQLRNIETGYLVYHSFQEDSMTVSSQSQLDFNATIDVTLNGKRNTYRLKITEVWAVIPGGGKGYHLICRKAIRL